ncbi:hypothetical protein GCM10023191_062560 [Actinoallomurus oryzae]|uniref:Uncharacterized protein n=1 Tax=Actinoallomurus oryzae TaxID=502180 RepID=A0ABP8QQF2_9ACTN
MPTVEELRQVLDQASADAPDRTGRVAEVRRRIRRGNRMRVAGGAVAGVAALGVAGLLVPGSGAGPGDTGPATINVAAVMSASSGTALPDEHLGMRRIAAQRFSVSGKKMRITFTPTGPNTETTIQCRPGSIAVTWTNGHLSGYGDCNKRGSLLGSTTISAPDAGPLPVGKPVVLDMVVLPATVRKTVAIVPDGLSAEKMRIEGYAGKKTISRYLKDAPVKKADWSAAVYSGTCKGDGCPPTLPPSVTPTR